MGHPTLWEGQDFEKLWVRHPPINTEMEYHEEKAQK